jgi:hypothetical protein
MKTLTMMLFLITSLSCLANPVGGVLGGGEEAQSEKIVKEQNIKVNEQTKPCIQIDENKDYIIWQCKK